MLSIRAFLPSVISFFSLGLMIGLSVEVIAADFIWIGAVDGNWITPANWGTSDYPFLSYATVILPKKAKNKTITIGTCVWRECSLLPN